MGSVARPHCQQGYKFGANATNIRILYCPAPYMNCTIKPFLAQYIRGPLQEIIFLCFIN